MRLKYIDPKLISRLEEYWEPADARKFLYHKQPLLNDRRPIDLIHENNYIEIYDIFNRLDHGVYI